MAYMVRSECVVLCTICGIRINGVAARQTTAVSVDTRNLQRLRPHVGPLKADSMYGSQRHLSLERMVVRVGRVHPVPRSGKLRIGNNPVFRDKTGLNGCNTCDRCPARHVEPFV